MRQQTKKTLAIISNMSAIEGLFEIKILENERISIITICST